MNDPTEHIERLRREVDRLDARILESLNERAAVVTEIGKAKSLTNTPVYQPAREAQVINNMISANTGPMPDSAIAAIFAQIMASGRPLEHPIRVAFLGPEQTHTHRAAEREFGTGAEYDAAASIPHVFSRVERGGSDYGVVPIENSTAGTVGETLDMFVETTARIVGETTLSITHHLLSSGPMAAIKVVYSHPQALDQCRKWLAENLPLAERVEVASTAAAASRAAAETGAAALGPKEGAEAYGLAVVRSDIQDFADNTTRFFVLGRASNPPTGDDRTALIIAVIDRVGALHDVLGVLRSHNLNLSSIQSRPARRQAQQESGDYVFFVEFGGHPDDDEVKGAVDGIRSLCSLIKVLGAWPARNYEH